MAAYTTIDDSEAHFQCVLYTGDGNDDRSITLPGETDMAPNIVWVKGRQADHSHRFYDSVRGATKYLNTATAGEESTAGGADGMQAFESDGFQIGTDGSHNINTDTYIAWCWKESATAGLDIISMTGTGSARTQAHSLSAVPKMIIVKCLDDGNKSWAVYHKVAASDAETDVLALDAQDALADDATYWNDTVGTSSVFTVGTANGVNKSTKSYIAFVWAPVQGFSKFGSYFGNSNSDGAFVHTGFSPSLVMVKCSSNASTDWLMVDNKRSRARSSAYNNFMLRANTTAVEENGTVGCDFLSNGFKWRDSENSANVTGRTYIYMAFAHSPFVNSNGVPCTATAATGAR